MPVHPIKNELDYKHALAEIDSLFDAEPGTSKADELDVLTTLVEAYERKFHPMPPPDPIEALLYHLESRGLTRRDLEPYIGTRIRVAEVLDRRRALTLGMIRKLHEGLGIPAESLLQVYPISKIPNSRSALKKNPAHA